MLGWLVSRRIFHPVPGLVCAKSVSRIAVQRTSRAAATWVEPGAQAPGQLANVCEPRRGDTGWVVSRASRAEGCGVAAAVPLPKEGPFFAGLKKPCRYAARVLSCLTRGLLAPHHAPKTARGGDPAIRPGLTSTPPLRGSVGWCSPKSVLYPTLRSARTIACLLYSLICIFMLCGIAAAQNITGTVTNATTSKPSVGDEVTLLSLSQGMQEVASTKSDAGGHFSFAAPADANAPYMVRATHQGVNYFPQGGPLMSGATTAELTVYDSAKSVNGLSQTVEVDRYQSDGKQLQGIALYAVRNQSQPPRTLADDKRTFEFVLPDGAELESAQAKAPGGQPIAVEASPTSQKNHYAFNYPLRPGETQFQVSYHMPYSGEASISPKPPADVQHFVVMTPKGMTFTPKNPQQFQSMPDNSGAAVMVVTNVKPGQDLSFRIAGTGVFQAEGQQGAQGAGDAGGGGAMGGSQAAANDNRPGGGLGAPIDAPDPLHEYRAYILGAFALVLVMGGAYVVAKSNVRPQPATAAAGSAGRAADSSFPAADFADYREPAAPQRDRNALLLEAMKEELFQLEIDRQQGKISPEEYVKAKAALDETIKRALARSKMN